MSDLAERTPSPIQLFAKACRIHAEQVAGMGDARMEDDEYPVGGVPRGLLSREVPPDPGPAYWCRKYVRDWKRRRRAWRGHARRAEMSLPIPGAHEMIRESELRNGHSPPADPEPESAPEESPKSGYHGVYWHKQAGKWQAQASVAGKVKSFGLFADPEEAAKARAAGLEGKIAGSPAAAPVPRPAVTPPPRVVVPAPPDPPRPADPPPLPVTREDPEVAAIAAVAKALSGLDVEATRRVIDWAIARFSRRAAT